MEQETLFTSSKWDILKVLSYGPKSPLELAKLTNTSIANISQQLRLLELAGLVNKDRVSNRDKDQPRLKYSLGRCSSYIINTFPGFVKKDLLDLIPTQQFSVRVWFTKDQKKQYFLEKYFWQEIEPYFERINAIYLRNEYSTLRLFIVTNVDMKSKIKKSKLRKDSIDVIIEPEFFTTSSVDKIPRQDLEVLYDPQSILSEVELQK